MIAASLAHQARPAWIEAAGLAALLLAPATLVLPAEAATSTIGRTWPIAEPDALSEIEGKVASLPPMTSRFGPRSDWTAMRSAALGVARRNAVRTVVPFYTLGDDIRLPDGRVLYPKGFTFNPLTYVRLPQRLIVVHAGEVGWALDEARPTDWILLASGSSPSPDPIALSQKVGRPIFILEDAVRQRLGLTVAPVIISQAGTKLVLDERAPAPVSRTAR
ncbi:conjugal transfer protein TraW [Sphingomonas chungangi]|uniref:conjugal transfer protein TraW n=1 Tax=Sphingomonas chungangi TaxID=2683589 RepID=UPI001C66FDE3|nr:conjugal transfer protein TraW [Sphingomonas chungangi]